MSKAALLGADLVWGAVAMPGDEPSRVVVGNEVLQPAAQLFDGVEGVHPEKVLLQGKDGRSSASTAATPVPSGWWTKAGELSMPRKAISSWKSRDR